MMKMKKEKLEEKVERLEKIVKNHEKRIERLEGGNYPQSIPVKDKRHKPDKDIPIVRFEEDEK